MSRRSWPRRASPASTFSCDIAYSDSPTASRASAGAMYFHSDDLAVTKCRDSAIGGRSEAAIAASLAVADGVLRTRVASSFMNLRSTRLSVP